MCGIAGILGSSDISKAKAMVNKLVHRGPDHQHVWTSGNDEFPVVLAHSRLSIIDTSHGSDQPMLSNDGRFAFTFNGEIYNYSSLQKLYRFKNLRTHGDTEVFLRGLSHIGPSFMEQANGMWAYCLWDRTKSEALIARDRFGIKPLYYYISQSQELYFASELKALTCVVPNLKTHKCISRMLQDPFRYESTSQTIFRDVYRLPPGHLLVYKNGEITIKQWWNTLDHCSDQSLSYSDQVSKWSELFEDSVTLRMISDVPFASCLSGGLDSSAILASVRSRLTSFPSDNASSSYIGAFCSTFIDSNLDESYWADKVSAFCNLPLHYIPIDPKDSPWNLTDAFAVVEDPYITNPLPMLLTYKAISDHGVKVSIDGHGADELLSGYGHFLGAIGSLKTLSEVRKLMALYNESRSSVFSTREKHRIRDNLKTTIQAILISSKRYRHYRNSLSGDLLSEQYCSIRNHPYYQDMDPLNQILYELFHLTTLPTLLRNYDRYSMASGVEVRMPFMDWRLVCFAFSLPWTSKISLEDGLTKRIQRDSLCSMIPDSVRKRKDKIGWNAPLQNWLADPYYDEISSIISTSTSENKRRISKSWETYCQLSDPTFVDAQNIWHTILPLVWEASLSSPLWR